MGGNSGVTVNNGNGGTKTMNYLEEAKKIIKDFADTTAIYDGSGFVGWISGHIGIDGYAQCR